MPRLALLLAFLGTALGAVGCTTLGRRDPAPVAAQQKPSDIDIAALVAPINANAEQVKSFRCDKVDISGNAQKQPFTLSGKIAFEQGNRFRMVASLAGKSEVDVGSNEDEVWFWVARARPPAVYFCKQEELPNIRSDMPFDPKWVIDCFGIGTMNPDQYKLDRLEPNKYISLVSREQTPAGEWATKRVLISPQTNRVIGVELFDANYQRMMIASLGDYYDDPETKTYLPTRIQIEWPGADAKMKLSLRDKKLAVNQITPNDSARLFTRGQYIDTQVIDLAKAARMASGVQPAGAEAPPPQRQGEDPSLRRASGPLSGGPVEFEGTIQPDRPRTASIDR